MPKPFAALSDEFNATAKAYVEGDVSVDLLTTKYSVLMAHKAQTLEERQQLVESLYDCGLKWLNRLAEPGNSVEHVTTLAMLTLFSRLTEEDGIALIPRAAPEQLTDASLDLLRRAESPNSGGVTQRSNLVKLAAQTLAAADKIKAAHDLMLANVATSQDITPSKKISLKQKDEFSL